MNDFYVYSRSHTSTSTETSTAIYGDFDSSPWMFDILSWDSGDATLRIEPDSQEIPIHDLDTTTVNFSQIECGLKCDSVEEKSYIIDFSIHYETLDVDELPYHLAHFEIKKCGMVIYSGLYGIDASNSIKGTKMVQLACPDVLTFNVSSHHEGGVIQILDSTYIKITPVFSQR